MGGWPWASIIGGEILGIAALIFLAGVSLASLIWWLA